MFSVNTVIHQPGTFAKEQPDDTVEYKWPEGGLQYIPDWIYTSPAIYQREIERIFHGPTWNFVGLEAEIPNPGDYTRSYVGPTPVVVARDTTCSRIAARTAARSSAARSAATPRSSSVPTTNGPTT